MTDFEAGSIDEDKHRTLTQSTVFDEEQKEQHRDTFIDQAPLSQSAYELSFSDIARRKRERFVYIKNWEDKRILRCRVILQTAEHLNHALCVRARESLLNFQQLIRFMKDRVQLDSRAANTLKVDISQCYRKTISRSIQYNKLNAKLQQIDDAQRMIQKSFNDFALRVDEQVIHDLMMAHQNQYQAVFDEFSNGTLEINYLLKREHNLTIQKYNEYTVIFTETGKQYMKTNNEHIMVKDLLTFEFPYLNHAHRQFDILRQYFVRTVQFYQKCLDMEADRVRVIRESFQLFFKLQTHLFKPNAQINQVLMCLEKLGDARELQQCFNLDDLIPIDELRYLLANHSKNNTHDINQNIQAQVPKSSITTTDISYESLLQIVQTLELQSIKALPLAIREFSCQYQFQQEPERECKLMLSLDQNWLVYLLDLRVGQYLLSNIVPVRTSHVLINEEKHELQIVETKKQLVGVNRTIHSFKIDLELQQAAEMMKLLSS